MPDLPEPLPPSSVLPPSSTTFSFKAPLQHRRVSLALPSTESPKLVPAWEFRDDTAISASSELKNGFTADEKDSLLAEREKRPRNKWSMEETQMLVEGCNRHGVGNWKAILKDPELKFENRSPVDLKDRFRTYFPDAYKLHYPNAKTHLSTKVRSTLPDGSPLFEKTRSKKRRPFTEEEDRALKAGYEKHGTVWAAIAKEPIFLEQRRRSTDLRDRFRNAFPELYLKAGYKPRSSALKKKAQVPVRAATDDQVGMSTTEAGLAGPRRKRRNTSQGLLRGGTKSVPQSTAPSEDEDSDDDETSHHMDLDSFSHSWSGLDTPTHSSHHTWSPTSSHLSTDHFYNNSSHSSPFQSRGASVMGGGTIGKSAWGTNDWFSPNPRLDPSSSNTSLLTNTTTSSISSSSLSLLSALDHPPPSSTLSLSPTPSSPFSFHALNHGVVDRYDLVPTSFSFSHLGGAHEFGSASEMGLGDTQSSTFSDDIGMYQPTGFRGFTHHSSYAGDLIFGARTHQPQPFSFGLGLSGMHQQQQQGQQRQQESAGINPMQLHTPSLGGIEELELTGINGISLNDAAGPSDILLAQQDPQPDPPSQEQLTLDDLVDLDLSFPESSHLTPPGTPLISDPTPVERPFRTTRTRSVNFHSASFRFDNGQGGGRSISVPPGEDRDRFRSENEKATSTPFPPPPPPPHFLTPLVRTSTLPLAPVNDHLAANNAGDLYDLPFLDLHYNYHQQLPPAGGATAQGGMNITTTGQALDLATSPLLLQSQSNASSRPPPPPPQTVTTAGSILFSGSGGQPPSTRREHQRGQSAVQLNSNNFSQQQQELLSVRSKRKRASWDGGPGT